MLPYWIKEYFSFHRTERRGIIVLIVLVLLLACYNICQRVFWRSQWQKTTLEYGPSILKFTEKMDSVHAIAPNSHTSDIKKIDLFAFDPNTLDSTGWTDLGFSPKQTASIIHYRSAGAVFRKPEDLKKLFVIDEEQYLQLQPYVNINEDGLRTEKTRYPSKPKWEPREYPKLSIELNMADTEQLKKLTGIGPSFSKRIIGYRQLLGGFIRKQQILEVYGMDSLRYLKISDQITVDSTIIRKINVNEADMKELLRHPYLDLNQARAIVNYRSQHGPYTQLDQLRNIHLIKENDYRRIAPYLSLE